MIKIKHKHFWTVIKTIWPYKEGWGVWCPKCKTVLKTGLLLDVANEIADTENSKEKVNV